MSHRGRAFFADQREIPEPRQIESADQFMIFILAPTVCAIVQPHTGVALKPHVPQPASM